MYFNEERSIYNVSYHEAITVQGIWLDLPLVMATANAEAESNCSSSISWWWGTWLLLGFWWLLDALIDPGIPWFGTDIAADDCSLLVLFPFMLHECWAVAESCGIECATFKVCSTKQNSRLNFERISCWNFFNDSSFSFWWTPQNQTWTLKLEFWQM